MRHGGGEVLRHHDALARGERVVLDDVRRPEGPQRVLAPRPGSRPPAPAAVGIPAAVMTSLAKALDPSIRAAAASGPKTAIPAARSASATPATSGASGPTTTSSAATCRASRTTSEGSLAETACSSASSAIPGFPGAACSSLTSGSAASARTIACSRPPPPMTSTRTSGSLLPGPLLLGDQGKCGAAGESRVVRAAGRSYRTPDVTRRRPQASHCTTHKKSAAAEAPIPRPVEPLELGGCTGPGGLLARAGPPCPALLFSRSRPLVAVEPPARHASPGSFPGFRVRGCPGTPSAVTGLAVTGAGGSGGSGRAAVPRRSR